MSGVEVRVATLADLTALMGLRQQWAEEQGVPQPDPEFSGRFEQWFRTEIRHRTFWLATIDGTAVGMVNLLTFTRMPTPGRPGGGWGYLGNMYVAEAHRTAGIGRLLLDALVSHANAEGLERVVLKPTERSVSFYRRAGFDTANELLLRPQS